MTGLYQAGSIGALIVTFDTRIPGVAERLHRERAAWQEDADLEALDHDHYVLTIKLEGARRLAS